MEYDPHSIPAINPEGGQPFVTGAPSPPTASGEKSLLAPVWHTVLMIVLLVLNSLFTGWVSSHATSQALGKIPERARVIEYVSTIALELLLLLLVWVGLRLKQTKLRDVIGGRWDTPEAFLIDIGIALGFWVVAIAVLGGLGYALGLAKPSQATEAKKLIALLAPQTWRALGLFVVLSAIAGYVEEIIFRGYLQRQLAIISGNIYVGLIGSALVFGGGHGYEGTRRMIIIFVYGVLFGLLALWRKSLRPGMIAHAWHDAIEGFFLFLIARGVVPMR
jgi:membrane protease YdiL (CAAX protease family)